jgi:NADH-quinone oxidoreductase subunit A
MLSIDLVAYLALFILVGVLFLFVSLLIGRFIRPHAPSVQKSESYECGEPSVGSSFIQFDLRFYVVALLFIIFDVEVAFFFPWAVVFGSAVRAGDESQPAAVRIEAAQNLQPQGQPVTVQYFGGEEPPPAPNAAAAKKLAWLAFADIMVFFGVLLVGFAYLWRRGDLEWVRSMAAQEGVSASVGVSENHAAQPPPPVPATAS